MRNLITWCVSLVFTVALFAQGVDAGTEVKNASSLRTYFDEKAPSAEVLPRSILLTFVAAGDRGFFVRHSLRSPITIYLARMLLGQNYDKMKAPALSLIISTELTKDEILSLYAMEVYFGSGCFGIEDASRAYFAKTPQELTLSESAYLASVIKSPTRYHPLRNSDRALRRRNYVLSEMQNAGFANERAVSLAKSTALTVQDPLGGCEE